VIVSVLYAANALWGGDQRGGHQHERDQRERPGRGGDGPERVIEVVRADLGDWALQGRLADDAR
jgi:hypothetical protein